MDSMPVDPPAPANFIRTPSAVLGGGRKSPTTLFRYERGTAPYAARRMVLLTVSRPKPGIEYRQYLWPRWA